MTRPVQAEPESHFGLTLSNRAMLIARDISKANDAGTLHACSADIHADEHLEPDERLELESAIRRRFAALNAAALQPAKPRWT